MLCQKCGLIEATIHLNDFIDNNNSRIVHLCEKCAIGITEKKNYSLFSDQLQEMIPMVDETDFSFENSGKRCKTCGATFNLYKKNGKFSCPDCYEDHKNLVNQVILSIFGKKKYLGKHPQYNLTVKSKDLMPSTILNKNKKDENLSLSLQKAIDDERYEDAAILRDRINSLSLQKNKKV